MLVNGLDRERSDQIAVDRKIIFKTSRVFILLYVFLLSRVIYL